MKRASITLATLALFALACVDQTTPTAPAPGTLFANVQGNGVVHRVSVGSSDGNPFPHGTDGNFSLIALVKADGGVSGQWQDAFGRDFATGNTDGFGNGVHVDVNCVEIVGNQAWISGVATDNTNAGKPVITRVRDNGTSANQPEDEISFSFIGFGVSCHTRPNLPLFPINGGEVKVE